MGGGENRAGRTGRRRTEKGDNNGEQSEEIITERTGIEQSGETGREEQR